MFRDLPPYGETRFSDFWTSKVPSSWSEMPGLAVLEENRRTNKGLVEDQVLSLSYGKVIIKPVEKQRGLVPESYEGYQILDPGDIVVRPTDLQNDQTSIRVGHVRDRGIITSAYIGLRPRGEWSDAYAYLYLSVIDSSKRIYGMGSGLRQQLGWEDLKRMPCLVPPVKEQAAIVKYLAHANARIDNAIAAKRRLIALLEEQWRTEMRSAVLGKDHSDRADSGLHWVGEISTSWRVRKLRSLFVRQGSGTTPAGDAYFGGGVPWVMSGDLNNGLLLDTARTVTDAALREISSLRMHPAGSLVIAMYGATIGKTGILAVDASTNQACSVLSEPRPGIDVRFVQLMLSVARPALQELGAGGGQPNINGDKVAQFRIPMPPYEEQQKIVVQMDTSTRELHSAVAKIDREIELLQEFRTRLVADVVTGQVDVGAISASLPDASSGVAVQDIHEAVADDDFSADEFGEVG